MDLGNIVADLRSVLLQYILFVVSLCIHEWVRAKTIDRLGDPNPSVQGRVTLNPLAHLDLIGSVAIPLICVFFGMIPFGWGKPLVSNPSYFSNPKRGEILSALSGSAANAALMLFTAIGGAFFSRVDGNISMLVLIIIQINGLMIALNLIPIPPRDGGVLLKHLVGMSEETFWRLAQWGWLFWLMLLLLPSGKYVFAFLIRIFATPFWEIFLRLR
jgi:Zn-dependent protease